MLGENNGLKLAQLTEDKPAQTTTHSILQWGKGIIQDLGLGLAGRLCTSHCFLYYGAVKPLVKSSVTPEWLH